MTGIDTAADTAAVSGAVEAGLRAVAVDRGQENLARAAVFGFPRPLDRVAVRGRAAAARVDREAIAVALGVDGDDDRLAAVPRGERRDERGVGERRGVQAHLVGAGLDGGRGVGLGADAAADGERNEQLARDAADRVGQRAPPLERRRDVEDDELVDAFGVVAARQLRRIAGRAEPLEVHALDDLAVADVEARDDPLGEHYVSLMKLRRICRPTSPDFSGWNWTPLTWPRWTMAANGSPCSVIATVSPVTGAT